MTDIDLIPLQNQLKQFKALGRAGLLPALHAAQALYGWLPEQAAAEVAKTLQVPLADVHGVIEFYSLFYNKPVSKNITRVCTDAACRLKGGDALLKQIAAKAGIQPGESSPSLSTTIEASPCLGMCEHAPAVWENIQIAINK